ncbi:HdeD family acid-resistance protein [Vandammella animalimorsus]|uniref:HdeD family acid-resistance protein n=1 Tax=Vandammella animalimorsus TaxID=2029117 RepID=A0A2A2ASY6_9BURK|nr:DUF308 domain-containing protein [Vandammella animalimorsus]PAT35760.1 hypothetical protein CK620_00285 [Vandammella animalimorsus]PAT40802.1 hypothetical protein CK621_13470 [Vandammella animalimorsus]
MTSAWWFWMFAGLVSLLGGVLALFNPFAATLTAELLVGWTFVAVGAVALLSALRERGKGGRLMSVLLGLVALIMGIELLAKPLSGIVSLTVVVGVILIVSGVLRIAFALRQPRSTARWALLLSGLLSLALAGMIFSGFPQSATVVLGLFLAIELISNGAALIMLALARKALLGRLR